MLSTLIILGLSAQQPSDPPPPPLPEKVVAVLPKEIELIAEKDDSLQKLFPNGKQTKLSTSRLSDLCSRRTPIKRRGQRNH